MVELEDPLLGGDQDRGRRQELRHRRPGEGLAERAVALDDAAGPDDAGRHSGGRPAIDLLDRDLAGVQREAAVGDAGQLLHLPEAPDRGRLVGAIMPVFEMALRSVCHRSSHGVGRGRRAAA